MIYITGDTHGDVTRFSMDNFPEQKTFTDQNENYVIICGDFGLIWNYLAETPSEKYWLNWIENKKFTTLFVDGNHEAFTRLYDYPVKEWNGGLVHEIRPHVLHLMRGQVFNIDCCTIFTFGGARSHDIDNLLDLDDPDFTEKRKQFQKDNLFYRVKGISWWEEEMPTQEEMQTGLGNLENNNWNVDYIITHDCTSSATALYSHGSFKTDELNAYLEEIRCRCEFKKWFFGHLHEDKQINDKEVLLYRQIVRIW